MEIYLGGSSVEKMDLVLNSLGARGKAAVARAMNRALAGVVTDASREVRREYPGVKARDIKKTFSTKRSSSSTIMGMARSRGHRQPLIAFRARPSKPGARRPPIGASVKVSSTRKRIRGAFVARMPSGHVGLFVRTGIMGRNGSQSKERIQELFTFAVPQAVQWIEENQGVISDGARERFEKNLDHEMDRIMKELGARY